MVEVEYSLLRGIRDGPLRFRHRLCSRYGNRSRYNQLKKGTTSEILQKSWIVESDVRVEGACHWTRIEYVI